MENNKHKVIYHSFNNENEAWVTIQLDGRLWPCRVLAYADSNRAVLVKNDTFYLMTDDEIQEVSSLAIRTTRKALSGLTKSTKKIHKKSLMRTIATIVLKLMRKLVFNLISNKK